jgi:phospholipase C
MALAGYTHVENTHGGLVSKHDLVLDWLNRHHVPWRVYHSGLSFFLVLQRFEDVLGSHFRDVSYLARDVQHERKATFPKVILIEPSYVDAPIHFGHPPNDNHPPLPVGPGEHFLRLVYQALTSNPARWARTLLVITYDEHGGFFDHVAPPKIEQHAPNHEYPTFTSAGVRVPTLVVSPCVKPGTVFHGTLDHTSVLQLIAERFAGNTRAYSSAVNTRIDQGVNSVSSVLNLLAPRTDIPPPPSVSIRAALTFQDQKPCTTESEISFQSAAMAFLNHDPARATQKHPELAHLRNPET